MYLKQIELENFKSFGRRLTIPLLEGYTVVTGPNGSGKSNISDAILFVLGPRSSRAIRAGKLTDLIFNGGKSRNPATFTRVSLVFDNTDRMIPLDTDTVKLTRVVKLSQGGDGYNSYFYVNGRKSTLSEFDELLSNSRISADGYNVVQQGDVTRIVEMSDLERRRILDDISGISKFDQDIEKAETERAEAERNIERITIIREELEKQISQLERERETATRYLSIKERLEIARAQMAHKRRESILSEIGSINEQLNAQKAEMDRLRERRQEIIGKIRELEDRSVSVEKRIEEKGGEEFRRLKERIDEVRIELARTADAADRASEEIIEIEESIEERRKERDSLEMELAESEKRLEALRKEMDEKSSLLQDARQKKLDLESRIRETDDRLERLETSLAGLEREIRDLEERRHSLITEKERLEIRISSFREEIADLEEEEKNIVFEINDIDWNLKQMREETRSHSKRLKELQAEYHSKKGRESKLSQQAVELEQAILRMNREYNRLKTEAEAAEKVARGYTRAVEAILEARDRGKLRGIHGTVAELARVDEKFQLAMNVAAGSRMQAIVVDDDEVAAEAIQLLKRRDLGRAIFLPLNKMREYRPKGKSLMTVSKTMGFAIDLIEFDEKYRAAFSYVFGDTMVVESLDDARKLMGGVRLVTLEGELIEASGAMVGGTLHESKIKFGDSSRGKLDELGRQLQAAIEQSEQVNNELRELRTEMIELERAIRDLSGSGGLKDDRIREMESKKEVLKGRLDAIRKQIESKKNELKSLDERLTVIIKDLEEVEQKLVADRRKRETLQNEIMDLAPKAVSRQLREVEGEIGELTNAISGLKASLDGLQTSIRLLKERRNDIESEIQESEKKKKELNREERDARERIASLRTELAGLKKIEDSMGQEMAELRALKESLFKEKTALEAEKDSIESKLETTNDFAIGLRTRLSVAREKLNEIEQEISGFEVEVEYPLPTLESIKNTIRECESSLSSMGAVNLRAIEDYEEKKRRYDELADEIARLENQRADLLALMKDLNLKKKESFLKVFEAVSENFKRIYAELSGGGEAELVLQDPENPFNGGLIIRARPKAGKAMRLQALSGGEKSLTALSFIFALQEYMPSPFYLLDEVDMFLDAVNADMVARRVQKASRTAQFVQITLRKVTMNKADHIIGVTMQEEGVSKIIMKPNISDGEGFGEISSRKPLEEVS